MNYMAYGSLQTWKITVNWQFVCPIQLRYSSPKLFATTNSDTHHKSQTPSVANNLGCPTKPWLVPEVLNPTPALKSSLIFACVFSSSVDYPYK